MQRLVLERVSMRAGANPNALLELLGRLQELQHLELDNVYDWPPASAAYGALAGGSKLQRLELRECSLPANVWQVVFPVGRYLPHLTELSVSGLLPPAMLSADGVRNLAGCCSGLRCLTMELQPCVQLPNNLSSLSSLTSLQMLVVSRGAFLSSLVTLQSLENLSTLDAVFAEPMPPLELVRLTCLRRLTALGLTYGDVEDEDVFCLYQQDRTSPPDVWQLLEHCARYPVCQPEIITSLSQQLAHEQQQRLETNSLLQLQQQQLDAAIAEAAELRGRLAAVEGQLQQLLACLPQQG